MKNIKRAYEIAIHDSQTKTPRNGYSVDQTEQIETWTTRIAALAAFLGWDFIVTDDDDVCNRAKMVLSEATPDRHEFNKYFHTYEICNIIIENGKILFGQI